MILGCHSTKQLGDPQFGYFAASEMEKTLCAIVFVERRYTALILSKQLNMAAKHDHELSFIKSNFVMVMAQVQGLTTPVTLR